MEDIEDREMFHTVMAAIELSRGRKYEGCLLHML
jgi:hypothetical protein